MENKLEAYINNSKIDFANSIIKRKVAYNLKRIYNKHLILEKSKFALTIENSNSYASEKIFDALINGSIPIYVGPKLESLGLPQDIAIEADLFSTSLIEILSNLDEPKIQSLINAGNSFLKTSDFKSKWTAESVYEEIGFEIMHFFEQK
jgi:hypothetical protein